MRRRIGIGYGAILCAISCAIFFAVGCVRQDAFDGAVKDAQSARQELMQCRSGAQAETSEDRRVLQKLTAELSETSKLVGEREAELSDATVSTHNLKANLEESTSKNTQIRSDLTRLGKMLGELSTEKGTISQALEDAKGRIDALSRAQQAAETATARSRDTLTALKGVIASDRVTVEQRAGHIVVTCPADALFESRAAGASATWIPSTSGGKIIDQIAQALNQLPTRKAQVRAHVSIVAQPGSISPPRALGKSQRDLATAPSPWETSTLEAVTLVRALAAKGVRAEQLSAAGYVEIEPPIGGDGNRSVPRGTTVGRAPTSASVHRIELVMDPSE